VPCLQQTENTSLETLNLSGNPVAGPTTDGIMQLRASLTFNNKLHTLLLSNTDMGSEGKFERTSHDRYVKQNIAV
jgi:hypothetical protein